MHRIAIYLAFIRRDSSINIEFQQDGISGVNVILSLLSSRVIGRCGATGGHRAELPRKEGHPDGGCT